MAEPAGWRGLWKGVGTGLVMSIPSASIYMLGYEYLLVALNGRIPGSTTTGVKQTSPAVVITPQHTTLELSNGSTAQPAMSTSTTMGQKQAYLSPVPFVAGSMARTISATVISPIELFRTRLQALPARTSLLLLFWNDVWLIQPLIRQRDSPHLATLRRLRASPLWSRSRVLGRFGVDWDPPCGETCRSQVSLAADRLPS
jgi:hypothetical protein